MNSFFRIFRSVGTKDETKQQVKLDKMRSPLIKFIGKRTPQFWAALPHMLPDHMAASAASARLVAGGEPRPVQAGSGLGMGSGSVSVPRGSAAKGPAAPTSVLYYDSVDLVPGLFSLKPLSQAEIDTVDSGGIFEAPPKVKAKPGKK